MYQTDRLNPRWRALLVAEAERVGVSRAARTFQVSRRTVYRWRRRAPDFSDRSSRPQQSPRRCPDALEARVLALRLAERIGPDRIGPTLGLPPSTVHRILHRHGAARLRQLFPAPRRSFGTYGPLRPGELVGIDIKSFGSLARGGGRRAEMVRSMGVVSAGSTCTSRSTWPAGSPSPSCVRHWGAPTRWRSSTGPPPSSPGRGSPGATLEDQVRGREDKSR